MSVIATMADEDLSFTMAVSPRLTACRGNARATVVVASFSDQDFFLTKCEVPEEHIKNKCRSGHWGVVVVLRLVDCTVERLIERFCLLAIREAEVFPPDEGRIWGSIENVLNELKRRDGDQRRALVSLFRHKDIRIRYRAADALKQLEPKLAKSRLSAIDDEDWKPEWANGPLKRGRLDRLTIEELCQRYERIGTEQDEAHENLDTARYNRLYGLRRAVEEELKSRPGDERRSLVRFLTHRNFEVRCSAAMELADLVPEAAIAVLREIAASHAPQSMNARGFLRHLQDKGSLERKEPPSDASA